MSLRDNALKAHQDGHGPVRRKQATKIVEALLEETVSLETWEMTSSHGYTYAEATVDGLDFRLQFTLYGPTLWIRVKGDFMAITSLADLGDVLSKGGL